MRVCNRTRRGISYRFSLGAAAAALSVIASALCIADSSAHASASEPVRLQQYSAGGHVVGFDNDGYFVSNGTYGLRVRFEGGSGAAPSSGSSANAASGAAPADDHKNAPPLDRVSYAEVWPGIAVTYDEPPGGVIRSTWTLAPGSDPAAIRLRYNVPVEVTASGELGVRFETGSVTETRPVAWQDVDSRRIAVRVAFETQGRDVVGFRIGKYRRDLPLIVDPTLAWNTFPGGGDCLGIAVDGSGSIYVAGSASATWGSPLRAYSAGSDLFVAKLSSTGTLVWNTFLGGSGDDAGGALNKLGLDDNGNIYLGSSSTASWGSPVRPYTGGIDAWAAKLAPSGALLWNTFLGAGSTDTGNSMTVDGSGNVYLTGTTASTWGNPVRPHSGAAYDAYAAKISTSGTVLWNTFFGTTSNDQGFAIAVDGDGDVYAGGNSSATWGSPVRAHSGGRDAFVVKLTSSGAIVWNTFLGGNGGDDRTFGLAVDASDNVYATGESYAAWGNPVRAYSGGADDWAAKLASSGTLIWSTFLGGSGAESATSNYGIRVALDGTGNLYAAGYSTSSWGNPWRAYAGGTDGFAAKLSSSSGVLLWNAFLGGSGTDSARPIAVDSNGAVYVCGYSSAFWGDPVNTNGTGFVAKLSDTVCGDSVLSGGEVCDHGAANGTQGDCCSATCQFEAASRVCRAAAGLCDVAENCTGAAATCPADAKSTAVCRSAAGDCDVADSCNGLDNDCPADGLKPSTTVCRASAGDCDVAETCTGTSATCPADSFQSATVTCRAAVDICDVAENCTGTSATCPADAFQSSATVCRPSAGACDVAETCTGTSAACPSDGFQPPSTLCRASAGLCDLAENCTGSSAACPTDAKSTAVCRSAAGDCDVAESCNGVDNDCPADTLKPSTMVCRASAGDCDVAEACSGTSATCPADSFQAATVTCRAAADICDVAENCTGASATCPADAFQSSDTVCRQSAGICDVAETCTGTSAACPSDGFEPSSTVCRVAAGVCDLAENCTGTSATCPADAKRTGVCRSAAGDCDVAESCNGIDNDCPVDAFEVSGTSCRPAAGPCDVAENCSGTSATCPADDFVASGLTCGAARGTCDVAETCTGSATSCPSDGFQPAGTACDSDDNVCTDDSCDGAGSCRHLANSAPCDDANYCNGADTCLDGACSLHTGDPCVQHSQCNGTCDALSATCVGIVGTACDDADLCTANDRCTAPGVCAGTPLTCDDKQLCTQDYCDPATGQCVYAPRPQLRTDEGGTCRTATNAAVVITARSNTGRLKWKWMRGEDVPLEAFGFPTIDTGYSVCIYDQAGGTFYIPAADPARFPDADTGIDVFPGTDWRDRGAYGLSYRHRGCDEEGVLGMALVPGTNGTARLTLKAVGSCLPVPEPFSAGRYFAFDDKVVVQVVNSLGECWDSTFDDATSIYRNTGITFKSKAVVRVTVPQ